MKISKYFNKISFKVALVVTVLVVGLFVLINFFVISRGERAFNDVYHFIGIQGQLLPEDKPFFAPSPNYGLPFFRQPVSINLTPREHFKTRFQSSLILIGLAALIGIVLIGLLISRIVAKPLDKLGAGMKKLRQSHYKLHIEEDEPEEFNSLIREFNSLADELNRTEELRKNLISDTSHELKTPLASLMAQLEGIDDGVITMDKERIKLLREQVSRLHELVESLQDYARLRSHTLQPQLKNFHFKDIINKIFGQYKNNLAEKKISVQLKIQDDYILTADPILIERIFTNLFDNTIRYSQAKNITISADSQQIVFADDGIGIPAQHLQDIFERFFRLEKSRNRKTGGLGLGLAIVKEIIEAHGWKIAARIAESNKGVEFVINFK